MANETPSGELRMDTSSLYREEVVTDRRVGSIRVLTPLKPDGSTDPSRAVSFVGEAQLLTPAGVLPLVFEIEAKSLAEAVDRFAAGARDAAEQTRRQIEELRREAASSIVVPDRMPGGLLGPGGPGGPPGGGKIHLR